MMISADRRSRDVLGADFNERVRLILSSGFCRLPVLTFKRARLRSRRNNIKMNTIIKLGLAVFAVGASSTLSSNAETPDATFAFTKHGLPVPGAYFQKRESQQPAMGAVSKPGGVGQVKQTFSKTVKTPAEHFQLAKSSP